MLAKRDGAPASTTELPVFLINLDRSPDRLRFMQAEAQRIGLSFERFAAVDGREALPDWLRPQFPESTDLLSGEVGCYASHLCVHRRILDEALPCAMVLEDDASLDEDLLSVARAAISTAPQGWDYIHLSGRRFKRAVYGVASLPNGRHLVRYMRIPYTTAGYLISRRGVEKMLKPGPRVRPIDRDIYLAWPRNLDVFGVYPSPVRQDTRVPTTIQGNMRTAGPPLLRLRGHLYCAGKIGLIGYLACRWADAGLAIQRRLGKSDRGVVPVVMARA